jgi:hypothetical protein
LPELNARSRRVTPIDIILIALAIAATVVSGVSIYGNGGGKLRLAVEAPTGRWIYDLKTDRTIEIPGTLGETIITVSGGEARIVESPCPNKTCIAAPGISHKGEWNACLPNRVIIRIEGNEDAGGLDAVVY